IDWGDHTSTTGLVSRVAPPGSATDVSGVVAGSHTYAAPGRYAVVVTITTPGGSTRTVQTTSTVGSNDERFIGAVYRDVLERSVDLGGLSAWTTALDRGMSAAQVVRAIVASPEYEMDQVQAVYHQLLHRDADPQGLTASTRLLALGGSLNQIATVIASSSEYFHIRA